MLHDSDLRISHEFQVGIYEGREIESLKMKWPAMAWYTYQVS